MEIEEAESALRDWQELFMHGSEEPLSDDFEIEYACIVALCVKLEEEWEWDAASDLIKDKVSELSGPNNSIATKSDQDGDYGGKKLHGGRVCDGGGDRQAHHLDEAKLQMVHHCTWPSCAAW